MRRSPGFAAIAIAILAVGIGANALMFTAVDALLLRAPAIADPGRVVSLYAGTTAAPESVVSYLNYASVRESGVLADVAAFSGVAIAFDDGRQTDLIPAAIVTGNYFSLLGVIPAVGRTFLPEEDRTGDPVRVAVVSHAFWQARLGGDPSAVGREIRVNGRPYAVVGVAPAAFRGLDPGRRRRRGSRWRCSRKSDLRPRRSDAGWDRWICSARAGPVGCRWSGGFTRLRRGIRSPPASRLLAERMRQFPENDRAFHLSAARLGEGRESLRTEARPLVRLLSAAALLVLLIVCANVAGLFLARDAARRRELAVRASLGATGWRLVRQSLTESILLGIAGGVGECSSRTGAFLDCMPSGSPSRWTFG